MTLSHQSWQLHLVAGANPCQRDEVLPLGRQDHQRASGPVAVGCALHKTEAITLACDRQFGPGGLQCPVKGAPCLCIPCEQVVHGRYRSFPGPSSQWQPIRIIAYHCDSNTILACPFKSRKDAHRLLAYEAIMTLLRRHDHNVDLQILDNEASAKYKRLITKKYAAKYQLVPPDIHRRNAAERAIRTFKAHCIAILAGVADNFPRSL